MKGYIVEKNLSYHDDGWYPIAWYPTLELAKRHVRDGKYDCENGLVSLRVVDEATEGTVYTYNED